LSIPEVGADTKPFHAPALSHGSPASATSIPGTPTIHRARVCASRAGFLYEALAALISLKVFW
jgi:hypothetical protein